MYRRPALSISLLTLALSKQLLPNDCLRQIEYYTSVILDDDSFIYSTDLGLLVLLRLSLFSQILLDTVKWLVMLHHRSLQCWLILFVNSIARETLFQTLGSESLSQE